MFLGTFFSFLGLQQLHLDLTFDLDGKPRQHGSMVVAIGKQTTDEVAHSSLVFLLGSTGGNLQGFIVIQVWFDPLPNNLWVTRIAQIEKAYGTDIRTVHMV
jgi:hypothetical protein